MRELPQTLATATRVQHRSLCSQHPLLWAILSSLPQVLTTTFWKQLDASSWHSFRSKAFDFVHYVAASKSYILIEICLFDFFQFLIFHSLLHMMTIHYPDSGVNT